MAQTGGGASALSWWVSWLLKEMFYLWYRFVATRPRSSVTTLVIEEEMTTEEMRVLLGRHYYDAGWLLSYHYYGEQLNMRRPYYSMDYEHPWRQVHLRGFVTEEGLEMDVHTETDAMSHPWVHWRGEEVDVEGGVSRLRQFLDIEGVGYRVVPPEQ